MADHSWDEVPYGHFGSATYDTEEHTWGFRTVPTLEHALKLLGPPTAIVQSTVPQDATSDEPTSKATELGSVRHARQMKGALRDQPDLQPAASLLRPLLQASEAVVKATSRYDPVKGELLAFGRANDLAIRRPSRLVAFPSGPTGCDVRIVQVQLQKQGWGDTRDHWLEVPTLAGEETIWKFEGSPVQQIAFAQPIEIAETLLAIRYLTATVILKPVLRRYGPARLEASQLYYLSTEQTGGQPHADVSFNPWFTRQFAVVDQSARWSVWEFESSRSTTAKCIRASSSLENLDGFLRHLNDGWARIMWLGNPNTVLVANRCNLVIFNISGGSEERHDIDVGLSGGTGWILDIAAVSSPLDAVCVLTTSHLLYFAMYSSEGEISAQLKARVRHYRNSEDLTIRLCVCKDVHYTTVTLRSALVSSIIVYHLSLGDKGAITSYDPFLLEMPQDKTDQQAFTRVTSMNLQVIEHIDQRLQTNGEFLGSAGKELRPYILATTLTADLSLYQSMYVPTLDRHGEHVVAPSWKGKLLSSASRLRSDELGLDDDMDALEGEAVDAPVSAFRQQRRLGARSRSRADWTVDYTLSVQKLDVGDPEVSGVEDLLGEVQQRLETRPDEGFRPLQTLRELAKGELAIADIDRASDLVAALSTTEAVKVPGAVDDGDAGDAKEVSVVRYIEPLKMPGTEPSPSVDLAATYDSIVAQCISSLGDTVPARTRLAKEQLVRRMAAEVTMASFAIRSRDVEGDEPQQDVPDQQGQTWKLPVRETESAQATQSSWATTSQNYSQSQNILPTPSPTATPSITTASSRTSFTAAEVSRLSKYTNFSKPPPSTLPRSLGRILSHWELGTDPESYDWLNTSRQITQQLETEEADSQLTERERTRLQRKAERHIRRQRKEAAASQQQHLASGQMPKLVVSASQPAPVKVENQQSVRPASSFGGVAASSQSQMPAPASQAVAGRFGGRPPVKKRRKQGF